MQEIPKKRYALFLRSRCAFAYDDRTRPQQAEFSVSIQSDKFELQLESAETRFRERLLSLLPDAALATLEGSIPEAAMRHKPVWVRPGARRQLGRGVSGDLQVDGGLAQIGCRGTRVCAPGAGGR